MIWEVLINLVVNFVIALLSPFQIVFVHGFNFLDVVMPYIEIVLFILPSETILTILSLIMAMQAYKIIVTILKTIWALLPIV